MQPSWQKEKTTEQLEQEGRHLAAAHSADFLASLAEGEEKYRRLNQAGINYRLAGPLYWSMARKCFQGVMDSSGNPELQVRAMRDVGMLYMEEGSLDLARAMLAEARFRQLMGSLDLEATVTLGFMARVEMKSGDKFLARYMLRDVDELLGEQNPVYTLNNLIWLMKVETIRQRYRLLPRAFRLARETGYTRRSSEALIIALSPWLYEFLKRTLLESMA